MSRSVILPPYPSECGFVAWIGRNLHFSVYVYNVDPSEELGLSSRQGEESYCVATVARQYMRPLKCVHHHYDVSSVLLLQATRHKNHYNFALHQ